MKRQAASIVEIGTETYHNHVVETDDEGNIIRHYPLTEELPHTEWHQHLCFGER